MKNKTLFWSLFIALFAIVLFNVDDAQAGRRERAYKNRGARAVTSAPHHPAYYYTPGPRQKWFYRHRYRNHRKAYMHKPARYQTHYGRVYGTR